MTKPNKTLADYMVISISPLLIMLLIWSLSFFLIQVLFHGPVVNNVRWVLFWFVLAVVLVSRIAIEKSTAHAVVYGAMLAAVTWIYLVHIHPSFFLGMILLSFLWWCAHKLTWDCTLIDEDADSSGNGLVETAGVGKNLPQFVKIVDPPKIPNAKSIPKSKVKKVKKSSSHPPGLWVLYFSFGALPLFGIGQILLPHDPDVRRAGFTFLFIYVAAALGLLLMTSFLGLRRYLRQRYLKMPGAIAFGWLRFGVGVAAFVLLGALFLPRPGANDVWRSVGNQLEYRLHQASRFAIKFSPHGIGENRMGDQAKVGDTVESIPEQADSATGQNPAPGKTGKPSEDELRPPQIYAQKVARLTHWLRNIVLTLLVLLAAWYVYRKRVLLLQMLTSMLAAIKKFFSDLFRFVLPRRVAAAAKPKVRRRPFAAYRNPFLAGNATDWTPEELVLYSYEAIQAWAEEQGIEPRPQRTASEFCHELAGKFPNVLGELTRLSFLYSHAAYGLSASAKYDLEPIKSLWNFLER